MCRSRSLAVAIVVSLCLVSSASRAVIYTFNITDKGEFTFLDIGPIAKPSALQGVTVISDTGNGTPTLQSMLLNVKWNDTISGANIDAVTGVSGSSVAIDFETTLGPAPNQTGSGDVTLSPVYWGPTSGWAQFGEVTCETTCPGGCIASACEEVFGFEGTGPPPPLTGTAITLDPWTFTVSGTTGVASFTGPIGGETFWLIPGSIKFAGRLWISGVRTVVPVLGVWGASALAGALLVTGYWWMSRHRGSA